MDMQNYTTPFANTGDKEEFSINTDPAGKVSLEKGWTELYQLRPEEGGLFILRKVFNQMMNLVSTDTVTWKVQAFPNWINDKGDGVPYSYPKNAIVKYTNGNTYVSKVDNNTALPTNATNWLLYNPANGYVELTGNQTIAGVKTFSSTIAGSVDGNSATATKLATARTINGVAFDGSANITVSDSTAVKLTGNQTIAGVKTFSSSPIVPTPTTDYQVATKKYVDDGNNINTLPNKPTPVDTDNIAIQELDGLFKKLSFANLMNWIKSFSFGWGQNVVTPSRSAGVIYTNDTNKPIEVTIQRYDGGNFQTSPDGITWTNRGGVATGYMSVSTYTIPVGWSYRLQTPATIFLWTELR